MEFLGLLDTVASVGVAHVAPVAEGHMSWADGTMELPDDETYGGLIKKCVHLVSGHEQHLCFIEMAIGKYGLAKTVVDGTIVELIYVSAVDTIDFFLNDETSLAEFMGTLATDVVKVGLSSAVIWGTGYAVNAFFALCSRPIGGCRVCWRGYSNNTQCS